MEPGHNRSHGDFKHRGGFLAGKTFHQDQFDDFLKLNRKLLEGGPDALFVTVKFVLEVNDIQNFGLLGGDVSAFFAQPPGLFAKHIDEDAVELGPAVGFGVKTLPVLPCAQQRFLNQVIGFSHGPGQTESLAQQCGGVLANQLFIALKSGFQGVVRLTGAQVESTPLGYSMIRTLGWLTHAAFRCAGHPRAKSLGRFRLFPVFARNTRQAPGRSLCCVLSIATERYPVIPGRGKPGVRAGRPRSQGCARSGLPAVQLVCTIPLPPDVSRFSHLSLALIFAARSSSCSASAIRLVAR
jgi:hypothetical protein